MTDQTTRLIAWENSVQVPTYNKIPIVLESGEGCVVTDVDGIEYLDFYGGHCVTILGHAHPAVAKAVADQASELLFYSNAVYSTIRAEASARLIRMSPGYLTRAFLVNSGSEANEAALKIARKATGRPVVVALTGDFHGRTLGSLATSWRMRYREPYLDSLAKTVFVPPGDVEALHTAFAENDVAAVLFEPIQSMAGMKTVDASFVEEMAEMCAARGAFLIADEVQTGVGRTGTFCYTDSLGVQPDMITLAKSLGNGVPVGATLVTDAVADTIEEGDQGTTFGGGMLAMAAMNATLKTIGEDNLMERAQTIFEQVQLGCEALGLAVYGKGCLMGVECGRSAGSVVSSLRSRNVLVGASGDPHVLRVMPPLIATDKEIATFLEALRAVMAGSTVIAGGAEQVSEVSA